MKIQYASVLLLVLGLCCSAQDRRPASADPNLMVVGQHWHTELRNPALDRDWAKEANDSIVEKQKLRDAQRLNDQLRARGMPPQPLPKPTPRPQPPRSDPTLTYIYEVTLRNDGKKDIAKIIWEYVFKDEFSDKEVGRRRFESKIPIASGRTRDLTSRSAIPPTGTVNIASKNKNPGSEHYSEDIVIISVEYKDGSKWSAAPK